MYLAYKHAKKRYRQHQEAKTEPSKQGQAREPEPQPRNQDAVWDEERRVLTAGSPLPGTPDHLDAAAATAKKSKQNPAESPEGKAEKRRRRTYRLKIIVGLFLPFTLQALDTTIIASALKFIADDFNELKQLNWIITAFNLTAAAFLPAFAQLADVFGRHAALQTALVVITVGSALCTAAPARPDAFPVLLLGRALQGVGAAGINICVRTVLADRVSLGEYAKNWTVFALVSGVGFGVGPVAGGYLTQASWRWCFAINLPVGVLGMVLVAVLLRREMLGPQPLEAVMASEGGGDAGARRTDASTKTGRFFARLATIDFGGQLLFLWGFGLLVLAFTWAGGTYPWDAPAVLVPLVVGGVLAVAWVVYEWAMAPGRFMARLFPAQKAMMPWELLMQKDIGLLFGINFATGAAMFAVMYFMDLYFTLVQGHSASSAGVALLYFLPGLGAGVYTAMFFVNRWPRQTLPILLFGTTSSAVGITVIAWACDVEYTNLLYGMMALTGFGIGMNMNPGSLHGLAYFPGMTAPITCMASFAVPFGGTVGLTIMSTVFNNRSGPSHADPETGIVWAFIAVMPIQWMAVLLATFLGNVWIKKDGNHEVVHGAWFWSRLRGVGLEKVSISRQEAAGSAEGNGDIQLKAVGEPAADLERQG